MGFGGVVFFSTGGYLADLNWRSPFLIYLFAHWSQVQYANVFDTNR
ncbi:MAG: hypothetical protein AAGE96_08860 [Cyanobacteria bacterium P01_G01_bin.19]